MSTPVPDMQPDTDEVLQAEAPESYQAIPVCVNEVKGPVRVQILPHKGGSTRTRTVTTTPVRLLTADHRRAYARLRTLVLAEGIAYAFSETAAQDLAGMSELPGLEVETLTATTELWVRALTGTTRVSLTTARWAEGE